MVRRHALHALIGGLAVCALPACRSADCLGPMPGPSRILLQDETVQIEGVDPTSGIIGCDALPGHRVDFTPAGGATVALLTFSLDTEVLDQLGPVPAGSEVVFLGEIMACERCTLTVDAAEVAVEIDVGRDAAVYRFIDADGAVLDEVVR